MSVLKLMSRIVAPDLKDDKVSRSGTIAAKKHDHTYGITSDPLTHFAVAFSALCHDADHTGVPNPQVMKENPGLAKLYKGRSVAEQNSVDLSWDLLMTSEFADLRTAIYGKDVANQTRFRQVCVNFPLVYAFSASFVTQQLVVNCVMATDIMDADLKAARNQRWDKAFRNSTAESSKVASDRKATIVIDHMIQASDVSHTSKCGRPIVHHRSAADARLFPQCNIGMSTEK